MATILAHPRHIPGTNQATLDRLKSDPAYQSFWLLRIGFTVAPILFGLDKFFSILADWDIYLSGQFADILPGTVHQSMYAVGIVEIAAGIIVALRPQIGAYVVAAWLGGIILNLLLLTDFYDIALRDFGLVLAALTLARLASMYPRASASAAR